MQLLGQHLCLFHPLLSFTDLVFSLSRVYKKNPQFPFPSDHFQFLLLSFTAFVFCYLFHLLGKHLGLFHPLLSFTDFVFSLYLYFAIMYIPWHFHCLVTFKTLDLTFICKQAEDDYCYNRNMFLKNVVFFLKILPSIMYFILPMITSFFFD